MICFSQFADYIVFYQKIMRIDQLLSDYKGYFAQSCSWENAVEQNWCYQGKAIITDKVSYLDHKPSYYST